MTDLDLDSDLVDRFIAYRKRSGRYDWGDNAAVRQMIDRLRAEQIISIMISPTRRSEREAAEDEFRQHLLQWRGLSPVTRGGSAC